MPTYRELIEECLDDALTSIEHCRQLLAEMEAAEKPAPPHQKQLFDETSVVVLGGKKLDAAQVKWAVEKVIAHYKTYHPRSKPGDVEKAKIRARLTKDDYSVRDLLAAIDGCHKSPYHCGDNDTGQKYQSLELIVRDSKRVQTFIEHHNVKKPAYKVVS